MNPVETFTDLCPWCSESVTFEFDTTFAEQEYIEDCSVCCAPILVKIRVLDEGDPEVELHRDNE